jgi:N-succinyldiaminopimelate aminotransferase
MVDISDLGFPDDVAFCRHLTTEIGVAAIPPSAFYQNPADGATLARFAFCKTRATLEAAASRLKTLQQTL